MTNEVKHESVDVLPEVKTTKKKNKTIQVINTSPNPLPEYATPGSAGMDVRAWCKDDDFIGHGADWDEEAQCIRIFSGGRAAIHTGLKFKLPDGYEMRIQPRSGLALKRGITVCNSPGCLDSDFVGELCVILINFSDEPFEVRTGDRIAQLIISKVEKFPFEEVQSLTQTDRGEGGFGHTGTN